MSANAFRRSAMRAPHSRNCWPIPRPFRSSRQPLRIPRGKRFFPGLWYRSSSLPPGSRNLRRKSTVYRNDLKCHCRPERTWRTFTGKEWKWLRTASEWLSLPRQGLELRRKSRQSRRSISARSTSGTPCRFPEPRAVSILSSRRMVNGWDSFHASPASRTS